MSNGSAHERTQFRDIPLPVPLVPAGYAAIIDRYAPHAPIPYTLCGTTSTHHPPGGPQYASEGPARVGWRLFSPRYHPGDALTDHLTFALKYEGINLSVLTALFFRSTEQPFRTSFAPSPPERTAAASGSSMSG